MQLRGYHGARWAGIDTCVQSNSLLHGLDIIICAISGGKCQLSSPIVLISAQDLQMPRSDYVFIFIKPMCQKHANYLSDSDRTRFVSEYAVSLSPPGIGASSSHCPRIGMAGRPQSLKTAFVSRCCLPIQLLPVSKERYLLDIKLVNDVMGNYFSVPLVGIRVPVPYHHSAFHSAAPLVRSSPILQQLQLLHLLRDGPLAFIALEQPHAREPLLSQR